MVAAGVPLPVGFPTEALGLIRQFEVAQQYIALSRPLVRISGLPAEVASAPDPEPLISFKMRTFASSSSRMTAAVAANSAGVRGGNVEPPKVFSGKPRDLLNPKCPMTDFACLGRRYFG